MSTRRTVTVRLRERQLEEIIEALEERMHRLATTLKGTQKRALTSAIDRCAAARDELMLRGDG